MKMESREELINKGLSFLARSEIRREIYHRINGRRTASEIARELGKSVNQILNEVNYLESNELIRFRKKIGRENVYEKHPKYAHLNLESRKKLIKIKRNKKTVVKPALPSKKIRRLLNFKDRYPEVFYNKLENEINLAYTFKLPNATLILSRKLIENLVYNLLEYKFGKKEISLYYNISQRRANDFGILLDNLENRKDRFVEDEQELIDRFLQLVKPFRREANSKTHRVIDYLDNIGEIKKFKIEEMAQILLKLIGKVK